MNVFKNVLLKSMVTITNVYHVMKIVLAALHLDPTNVKNAKMLKMDRNVLKNVQNQSILMELNVNHAINFAVHWVA